MRADLKHKSQTLSSAGPEGAPYLVSIVEPTPNPDTNRMQWVFRCPLCDTRRKNGFNNRGPAEMNQHLRKDHAAHKDRDVVYRACLLGEGLNGAKGSILTHDKYYQSCGGKGMPTDSSHSLGPGCAVAQDGNDGALASSPKRQRGMAGEVPINNTAAQSKPPQAAPIAPSTPVVEVSGDPPAATPPSTGIMTMYGARVADANIQWALGQGHGVEVSAFSMKFAPGHADPRRG